MIAASLLMPSLNFNSRDPLLEGSSGYANLRKREQRGVNKGDQRSRRRGVKVAILGLSSIDREGDQRGPKIAGGSDG
jgi:hypothetical protein